MSSIKLKSGHRAPTETEKAAIEAVRDDGVAMMRIDMPTSIHRILKTVSNELALNIGGRFGMRQMAIEAIEDVLKKYAEGNGYYQKRVGDQCKKDTMKAADKINSL